MALRNNAICKATRSFVAGLHTAFHVDQHVEDDSSGLGSLQKDKAHRAAYVAKRQAGFLDPVWIRLERSYNQTALRSG